MTSRVLFLDFDGPLHPAPAIQGMTRVPDEQEIRSRGLFRWIPHLETAFAELDEDGRSSIMIAAHSSWRTLSGLSQDLIRHQLGPKLSPLYIGMTRPDLPRWESIEDMVHRGGFEDYLILDDAVNEFPAALPQLVVCSPLRGLSDPETCEKVRRWVMASERDQLKMRMGS